MKDPIYGLSDAPKPPPPRPAPISYQQRPTTKPPADTDTVKNLYMPLWLLGGGVAIEVIAALLHSQSAAAPPVFRVGLQIIIGTALMLIGLLIAARLRGINLGDFGTVVLKLAAISIAPAAALDLASPLLLRIPLGWIAGLIGEFILYFALLGALFDLDESDTWYCVCVIFIVHVAAYFTLVMLF